jgi:hypothetical protein
MNLPANLGVAIVKTSNHRIVGQIEENATCIDRVAFVEAARIVGRASALHGRTQTDALPTIDEPRQYRPLFTSVEMSANGRPWRNAGWGAGVDIPAGARFGLSPIADLWKQTHSLFIFRYKTCLLRG